MISTVTCSCSGNMAQLEDKVQLNKCYFKLIDFATSVKTYATLIAYFLHMPFDYFTERHSYILL